MEHQVFDDLQLVAIFKLKPIFEDIEKYVPSSKNSLYQLQNLIKHVWQVIVNVTIQK